ncbi:TPA: hypothetical protein ACF32X_001169 [Streptococcus pyogenes]|uniref:hypothetical protein n=1 Tax=Streptococcus dysgalactiae TaxID=1334 RepID=UPI002B1B5D08|nr:hypothetical protein [Streptococcus pyogenes]
MTLQNIPDKIFYRLIEQIVDTELVWDKDTQIGSYYISIQDKYSFESGRDVSIYKILSSTQADVYKANKYNYQSLSKPDTGVTKPPTAIGLYQSITIDGLPIARVICNNQIIWSQSAEPQEAYNITAYVDANVSKLNDYAVIDYNQDFATYGVVWHRVDKVAVEVDGKIVAKLQKPVRTVAGGGAMLSIETWTYPFDGIDKYKNPTFKISQH